MNKRTEVLVGSVILLGVALALGGTLWLAGVRFGREEVELRARFREVGQLTRGNPVKVRGVPIGTVEAIELEPSGEGVIVTMRVQRDAPLPADAVVLLAHESLLGGWQAEIAPRSRYPRYAYAESPDPAVLPGASLPDISQLTAVADEIAGTLATLMDRVELAFTEETAHNVREAIENIQAVSAQLTGLVDSQRRAVDDVGGVLREAMETLNDAAMSIRRAFALVEDAIDEGELASIVDNVERTTVQMDSLSATLLAAGTNIRTTMALADSTLRSLGRITAALEAGEGSLGLLLQDSALYAELVRTNALVQALLADFKENPRKYIKLELF